MARFRDRYQAGRILGRKLRPYAHQAGMLVLGLPRGGVPVAFQVASALDAPLDVFLVRKLGVPGYEELALGAIATGGVRVISQELLEAFGVSEDELDRLIAREERELARREHRYRGTRPPPRIHGRTIILVDDGLATGATMRAAVAAIREQEPARVVVAVPLAPPETVEELAREVDDLVCVLSPHPFYAVGLGYESFPQTSDEEVQQLLERADRRSLSHVMPTRHAGQEWTRESDNSWR
jgi:putative phosphoribosyl transferase